MPRPVPFVLTLLVAAFCFSGTAMSQSSETSAQADTSANPRMQGGRVAYLDPATGKLVDHPPYGKSTLEFSAKALEKFSTSGFGLIERVLPNGLIIVDLRGRFRQGSVATTGADGQVKVRRFGGEIFANPAGRHIQESLHVDETANDPEENVHD